MSTHVAFKGARRRQHSTTKRIKSRAKPLARADRATLYIICLYSTIWLCAALIQTLQAINLYFIRQQHNFNPIKTYGR